jgi:hypothetical protein
MKLLTRVMVLTSIPAPTFLWESAGGGIPLSIGVSRIVPGTIRPITTDIIPGIPGILGIGEAIIRDMDGVTIQDGATIQDGDILPTGMGKPL